MTQTLAVRLSVLKQPGIRNGLKLAIYAERWSLAEYIPREFLVTGTLRVGDLTFIEDHREKKEDGKFSLSRVSTEGGTNQLADYIAIPTEHVGYPVTEPITPFYGEALVEPGCIQIKRVEAWDLIPRRWRRDVMIQRVRKLFEDGRGEIMSALGPRTRGLVEAFKQGFPAPAHVEYIVLVERLRADNA